LRSILLSLASPLQPLLIPAQLFVGCCVARHCSSSLLLCTTRFSLTTFAVPCFVVGWLLCCALLLILFTFAVACFALATFADPRSVVVTTAVAVTNAVANDTTAAAKSAVATDAGISWSRRRHRCR
jgi:hypothetical protein